MSNTAYFAIGLIATVVAISLLGAVAIIAERGMRNINEARIAGLPV